MQHIHILAVGAVKEPFSAACAEYIKRLGAYCSLTIDEIPESHLPKNPGQKEIERCIVQEGNAIMQKIPPRAYVAALCIEGTQLPSEVFSQTLDGLSASHSRIAFVIGGSHGLSEEVKKAASLKFSMSPMTFPHQLARVMLLEQVYRAFSIQRGGKYHK